jgi:hypothetical protein
VTYDTYIGGDTGNNELLFTSCFHGISELRVIPGIHFSVALDEGCLRVHLENLTRKRTIGTYTLQLANEASSSRTDGLPVSALVVITTGKSKMLPSAAYARLGEFQFRHRKL